MVSREDCHKRHARQIDWCLQCVHGEMKSGVEVIPFLNVAVYYEYALKIYNPDAQTPRPAP